VSELPDPLEAELASLRPQAPSAGLRRRIGERLADVPRAAPGRLWLFALAGGLAAACLAAVLLWRGGGRVEQQQAKEPPPRPAPPPPAVEDPGPTLLAYQRALARSPEELDALLAKHALVAPEPSPDFTPSFTFTPAAEKWHDLLGGD
jgi:hypothetical protein